MTKYKVGDKVYLTGGFPVEDGFGDLYDCEGVIEWSAEETDHLSEGYGVLINHTAVVVRVDHLSLDRPTLPADDDLIDEPIPYAPNATYEIDVRISDIERGKPSSELLGDDDLIDEQIAYRPNWTYEIDVRINMPDIDE